jgi:7-keto-8-aminopelargonate synthetase-like enzyme
VGLVIAAYVSRTAGTDAITFRPLLPGGDNRLPVTHGAGRWLAREGERWLNFSSNDYLGLSQHRSSLVQRPIDSLLPAHSTAAL